MPKEELEIPATVEDALREISRIKSLVTEAVEDGVRSAVQAIKHGRYAAEDVIEEAKHSFRCWSPDGVPFDLDCIASPLSEGQKGIAARRRVSAIAGDRHEMYTSFWVPGEWSPILPRRDMAHVTSYLAVVRPEPRN